MANKQNIDILENTLRKQGPLLDILLKDRTTGRNIIWATDSYVTTGTTRDPYLPKKQIRPDEITGKNGDKIQPRAAKSKEEQKRRTKDKAEVFTPLKIIKNMNETVDRAIGENLPDGHSWQDYVKLRKLEITCGEAPYIVSRYDPTRSVKEVKSISTRVGFLDKKLEIVSKYCDTPEDWLFWAKEAYKASYGYEWQGDNVLIARENLLYTLYDYYKDKFSKILSMKNKEDAPIILEFAEIISWNIWQMDGLKNIVPMSQHTEAVKSIEVKNRVGDKQLELMNTKSLIVPPKDLACFQCEGSTKHHNGRPAKIKDWTQGKNGKKIEFSEISN